MSLLLLFGGGAAPGADIDPASIATAESVPGPTITVGPSTQNIGSIASAESVPGPTFGGTVTVSIGAIVSAESVGAPNVFLALQINLPSIGNAAVVPGPTITLPSAPTPTERIVVKAFSRSSPTTLLVTFDEDYGRTWQETLNDPGVGKTRLGNDDPDLALVDYGDFLRFELDGEAKFTAIVESIDKVTRTAEEEVAEDTELAGRGWVAMFERALMYPELGADRRPFTDVRRFDYTSLDFDVSGWSHALVRKLQASSSSPYEGAPAGWWDGTASWIMPQPDAGSPPQPIASWFAVKEFTLATEGTVRFGVAADDGYRFYLDNGLVGAELEAFIWGRTKAYDVFLSAGTHRIAFEVTNMDRPTSPATNISALLFSAVELNGDGSLGDVLVNSDATWKVVAYPAHPPGFTVGAMLRVFVEENQVRGGLPFVALGFDDFADSAGNPWASTPDLAFAVGMDGLSVLRQLAEAYCDFVMDVGSMTLRVYAQRGTTTGATLALDSNLTELKHSGRA